MIEHFSFIDLCLRLIDQMDSLPEQQHAARVSSYAQETHIGPDELACYDKENRDSQMTNERGEKVR